MTDTRPLPKSNGAAPPQSPQVTAEESTVVGEDAWSLARIIGMIRRKVFVIGLLTIALSAYMGYRTTKQIPAYQSSFDLLVEPVQKEQDLSQLTDEQNTSSTVELDYSTQIEVLFSPQTLKPIIAEVNRQHPNISYDSVVGHLSISRLGETKIIQVTYYDTDPAIVKLILEKIAQGYLKYSLESQQAQLRQGLSFVKKQLPQIHQRVDSLQQQIQNLRQAYDFVDPDSFSEQLMNQLGEIRQQRQALRANLAGLQTQYRIYQQQAEVNELLSQSATYQALLGQFQTLEQQIATESARLGPNDPKMQLLLRQKDNMQPFLQQEAQRVLGNQTTAVGNQIQMLTSQDQAIAATEAVLNRRFQEMPTVVRNFTELQRELNVATDSLTRFLETQDRLEVQAAQKEIPWQMIAAPKEPKPKPTTPLAKGILTGAVMGLGLGLIVAYLLEKQENTYYTTQEFEKNAKYPILGIIPYHAGLIHAAPNLHVVDIRKTIMRHSILGNLICLKRHAHYFLNRFILFKTISVSPPIRQIASQPCRINLNNWLSRKDAHNFIDAFRTLYTNLQSLDRPPRSLVISSALPVEGKTIAALHLAQAATAMRKKVLLVDAHLRQGGTQTHALLNLSNEVGLSHFLTGQVALTQTIQQISWEDNLFVMTAGEIPLDPTKLLASSQMSQAMVHLDQTFDLVIYDMPPLMGLADVSLLAAHTDGVLLVAALGKRRSAEALKLTVARLRQAKLPILGIVVNRAKDYSVNLYR